MWRFWRRFVGEDRLTSARAALVPGKVAAGHAALALALIEAWPATRDWLAAGYFTLADVPLYACAHLADEAGFGLSRDPRMARADSGVARPRRDHRLTHYRNPRETPT